MTLRLSRNSVPTLATLAVLLTLYVSAGLLFENFFSLRVFVHFLGDNAFLGVVAAGMTFVIITGGIDLSVGAIVGCTTICTAALVANAGMHPLAAFGVVLFGGTAFGALQGWLVQRFNLQPFLVTLAGLFFCRGLGLWISSESIQANHPYFDTLHRIRIPLAPHVYFPFTAIVLVAVFAVSTYLLRQTRFGRTVYAIGGDEQSAYLMGLPVARTKVAVYALSGFSAALGGVLLVMLTSAGNALGLRRATR